MVAKCCTNNHKEAVIALFVEQDLRHQDQFWQEVAKELEANAQRRIANSLKALAWEGLGLGEAADVGKGSWQGPEEEEETKEKTPETIAGIARGAAMPAAMKAPTSGAKGLVLPTKKSSPTKPSSKCRGCQALRYEAPTQQDFSDKELARLLAPKQVEVVVDMKMEVGVVLKQTKRKVTVDLAMHQAFKEEWGACDKCWADNNTKACWYPVSAPPCFQCMAMKRLYTLDGAKMYKEEREGSKGKRKASLPLSPMEKGKKRARVVLPVAVTLEVESEEEEDEDEMCHLAAAIEASKAALKEDDLAGSSHQAEVPQDVSSQQEDEEQEEGGEAGPDVTPQAQPWSEGLPQWKWLPEWGAKDLMENSGKVPRITGEAFKWLEEDLAHLVVPLQLVEFLERMRAQAAHMERVLAREREVVQAELMGLCLQYLTLGQSVETLHNYQKKVTQALE
ncbi:hypothetical protein C0993_004463 [Termitomyces sp. T159_Od127]|nr:hypothetical protein C0993_004463 [Termitomyces sp. T159_Od127]